MTFLYGIPQKKEIEPRARKQAAEAAMEGGAAQQQAHLLDSFCGVTSATRDVALFFLESHNWILDAAIAAFYEHDEYDDRPQPEPNPRSQRRRIRSHDDDEDYKDEAEEEEDEEEEEEEEDEEYFPLEDAAPSLPRPATRSTAANRRPPAAVVSRVGEKRPPSKPSGSRSNIRTFADLNRSSGPGSDDDSDEPQEYYTGGEKSGMLVQDPSRGNHDVDSIFEQARQMGAMQGPIEPRPSSSRSFTGTGRVLSGETIQSSSQQPDEVVHNIYFWSNGFTVNDGPLRRFDDPENAAFLESIKKSECPKELAPADMKTMVNVNLIRKEEKCPEPAKQINLFQGVGRTLSNESSNPSITGTPVASDNTPSVGLSVDSSKPSTSVQLRLADGTRMVARFNTHHTVGDIRSFIDASRPGASRSYHLRTVGFPPKQLNDLMQTIEEAGLANSVIIQHF